MLKKMPQVREFMTRAPLTVSQDTPLGAVIDIFRKLDIRHVPVTDGKKLVGVLSERNVRAALVSGVGADRFQARDAMMPDPYVTDASTPLAEVADRMAEDKYGCAIVEEDGHVVGIFTTVDACRALRQVLATLFAS
jgi:acetoin utilization protein AcuB